MKTCTKCGVEKHPVAFYAQSHRRDGLSPWCKACNSAYSRASFAANKADRLAKQKLRYESDREAWKKKHADYRAANIDRCRAWEAAAYARQRDEVGACYAAKALGGRVADFPPDLIELKRQQLLLGRALREAKSLTKEKEDDQAN